MKEVSTPYLLHFGEVLELRLLYDISQRTPHLSPVMLLKDYLITAEPYYKVIENELAQFEAAFHDRMPIMLKGPTGCGKTRFIEHMAWRLKKPLITVSCHEDMTASDLVGRYLLDANGTVWHDGPLTLAVRHGAICYLDEIVEARQDTTVVIHSLTDDRRILALEKKNEVIKAHPDFQLVISYNPGYQSVLKDLKESTKQRFGAIGFNYPARDVEAEIVAHEGGVDKATAAKLVSFAERSRNLKGHGLEEGASTRMLIRVAQLTARGIPLGEACEMALILPITDDPDIRRALSASIAAAS